MRRQSTLFFGPSSPPLTLGASVLRIFLPQNETRMSSASSRLGSAQEAVWPLAKLKKVQTPPQRNRLELRGRKTNCYCQRIRSVPAGLSGRHVMGACLTREVFFMILKNSSSLTSPSPDRWAVYEISQLETVQRQLFTDQYEPGVGGWGEVGLPETGKGQE